MTRRRRNRKKDSDGFIFPLPLAAALGVLAAVSLTYLWLCGRCEALGGRLKALEQQKTEAHRRVLNEEYKLANMKTPQNIEQLLQRFGLQMVRPEAGCVVHLRGPASAGASGQMLAASKTYAGPTGPMVHD